MMRRVELLGLVMAASGAEMHVSLDESLRVVTLIYDSMYHTFMDAVSSPVMDVGSTWHRQRCIGNGQTLVGYMATLSSMNTIT